MGFIDFTNGEVLTAAQMDTTFRQTVMRFADSTARDTALSGVLAEGMLAYLDDTDEIVKYDGSSWLSISNPGDITAVTAGTALTGGGTSGDVTLNVDLDAVFANPLASFIVDSSTSRTLSSSDSGKTIRFTSSSATVATINASTDLEVGARIDIIADGSGELTVSADGATVAGGETSTTTGSFTVGPRYSAATILCVATDEYRLIGNVAAV